MIYEVYSVYDTGVNAYMQPQFCRARGEALRAFTDVVNNPESPLNKYPVDYRLFYLGNYNDASGMFDGPPVGGPALVCTAVDVLVAPDILSPASALSPDAARGRRSS